eukprot:jgi/Undpi1/6243/HiC_scaffold_20.g08727.m1
MEAIDTVAAAVVTVEATSPGKKEVLDAITDKVLDYYNKEHVFHFYEQSTVMDMGAGFGGTARISAKELGCKQENDYNVSMTKAAGLEDMVTIPGEKSYFETGMPDFSCEVVCSQGALLLGGLERHRAVAEAARVPKPGGRIVFTDIMRSDDATPKDLEQMYKRDLISDLGSDLGSVKYYKKWGKEFGLEFVDYTDYTEDMATHYESFLEQQYDTILRQPILWIENGLPD